MLIQSTIKLFCLTTVVKLPRWNRQTFTTPDIIYTQCVKNTKLQHFLIQMCFLGTNFMSSLHFQVKQSYSSLLTELHYKELLCYELL